jgi:hypothetical protein
VDLGPGHLDRMMEHVTGEVAASAVRPTLYEAPHEPSARLTITIIFI